MKKFILLAVTISFLSGCLKEQKCEYNECSTTAPQSEILSLQTYLQNNNINATQHCSGIFYVIHQQGSGARPTACGGVALHYKGMLTDGTVFDQTAAGQPASFGLGNGLIPGFKNAMLQLKVGGTMTFYIPPSLGYGGRQNGAIPPNSILIFEVELLDAQ